MNFFNTTNESGQTLIVFTDKAKNQKDKVFEFFKSNPRQGFTPFDVFKALFQGTRVPITSCRRSISDLVSENKVIKTNQKVLEHYGRPNFKYIYQPNENLYIYGDNKNKTTE